MEYIMFTDESSITASRHCSLTAVSLPLRCYTDFAHCMSEIIRNSNVTEFGWERLKNAKYFFCAEKMLQCVVENYKEYELMIDVLVWDTHDSRHAIIGRDDMANYERMFYHLLNASMKKRPKGSKWHIYPDERSGIDWETIQQCLSSTGKTREFRHTLFGNFLSESSFVIKDFREGHSHEESLIQLADLLSGLSVFSCEKYPEYLIWEERNCPQMSLFATGGAKELSNAEKFRSRLLNSFDKMCKCNRLGVSLKTEGRLKTFASSIPFNFWFYQPQGDYDKAPTR